MHFCLRALFSFLICLSFSAAYAQLPPCPVANSSFVNAGNDTTICLGQCAQLHGTASTSLLSTSAYSFSTPAYNPLPYNQGTAILLNIDDTWSSPITIPFNFCFFGIKYNQLVIGSNGNISFNLNLGTFNAFSVTSPIPSNYSSYNNCIMAPFFDMDPRAYGTIRWATYGTAPCRTFVVSWDSCGTYPNPGAGASYPATQQIVLYESTNVIDINVKTHQYFSGSTSSGLAVLGIQNNSATLAYAAPGKNATQFNDTNHTYRFTPSGVPTTTYTWTNAATNVVMGNTQNLTVCPTVTTTYNLKVVWTSQCDSIVMNDQITVTVGGGPHLDSANYKDPSYCGATDGYIRLYGLTPNNNYTIHYKKNGVVQPPVLLMATGSTGMVQVSGLGAGVYDSLTATASICRSNPMGPITLVDPKLTAAYTYTVNYGCSGDTVTFTNGSTGGGPNMAYYWDFGDGVTSFAKDPVHIFNSQNTFNVKLRVTNNICIDSVSQPVDLNHPLDASFTVDDDSACQGQLLTFTNTSITTTRNGINPQYFWDFGDGGTSNQLSPTYSFARAGIYNVRLIVKDFVPCYDTFYHTVVVDSLPFATFTLSDSVLCEGQGVLFTAHYLDIGVTGIEWDFGDGTKMPGINPISHAYDSSGTYTVKLTSHYRVCPDTNFTREVTVNSFPGINLGPDTVLCPNGQPIALTDAVNSGNPAASYLWSTGATSPYILANSPGTYWARVQLGGCSATDSITVDKDCYIDVPNSFTPNGDGLNDYFLPRQLLSRSLVTFRMQVFNRWGQVIFETTNINGRGWDGTFNDKPQPQGVFVYIIDAMFRNGVREHYTGNVTLMR